MRLENPNSTQPNPQNPVPIQNTSRPESLLCQGFLELREASEVVEGPTPSKDSRVRGTSG